MSKKESKITIHISTPILLSVITLVAIPFGYIGAAVLLWVMYGLYKLV